MPSISRLLSRFGLAISLLLAIAATAAAQTNTFTYQGKLQDNGSPASGAYDMQFKIFDTLSGGAQQPLACPDTVSISAVQVT
ncbi:MAG TPA: hypothetical protein VE863_06170, partial [Pyrinomonadaceae bacterium]|nr:hypothetical protein [Pyrinomonadaceae bacterium]